MFDIELFNKICDVSCTWDELEKFVIGIDKKKFDLDNQFSKYYSVERIICAIEKYQSKEVNAKFLAYWMNAYNWIIMGGFKIEDEKISLKEFVIWEISDWLDSLSFFDDKDDWYNLEEYKNAFNVLDGALKDLDNCNAVFSHYPSCDDDYGDDGEVIVLATNDKSKYFFRIVEDLGYADEDILIPKVPNEQLQNQINRLLKQGYTELKYCKWDDED